MKTLKIISGVFVLLVALGLLGIAYMCAGGRHNWASFDVERMFAGDAKLFTMGAGACLMLLFAMVFPCRGKQVA